jgi:hypothetical protein
MGVAPLVWLSSIDPAVQQYAPAFTQIASKMVGQ